ncbi:carbohydrate sulfotransferase 1 isoform X1 [Parasteatoda tepidariorum]|uniref:carbohydrate sulfotransferase 1 isoform X1 n=2 Tax=Parasteatoda tepidariorum TaxID=114398 RepID=UPI0039BD2635
MILDAMSGSRRFLLFLVLACVTCVVLVQITMDGKSTGNRFFPPYWDTSNLKDIKSLHFNYANLTASAPEPAKIYPPTSFKSTTAKPTHRVSEFYPKSTPSTNKVKPTVTGKGQVQKLPFGRNLAQQEPKILVSRQERLRELLKQSSVMHRRPTLDPMRSLKSIPLTDPSKVTRVFIITYFRAGSSFFGDILQQNWKTFYHFEPLHSMTYNKRVDDDKMPQVFNLFNDIFTCNFTEQKAYMDWVKQPRNQFLFSHNLFLWVTCHSNPRTCFNPSFVNAVCLRAPVHVMKLTRLHMHHLRSYLEENPDMKAKVIYLTRDPRGIVSSRWTLDWCNGTNCSDPGVLCHEMDEDIRIFEELQQQQPSNFIKVRYEDLSLNPEAEAEKLFRFLHLPFSPSVKKFLKTHTVSRKNDDKNPYSTRRNSTTMAFSWRERFSYKQIQEVQSQCSDVLLKLNHSLILSPNELPYPNGKPKLKLLIEKANSDITRKGIATLVETKRNKLLKSHTS